MAKRWTEVVLCGGVALGGCGDNAEPPPEGPTIAGQVWSDDNGDGLRDPGEPPLAGSRVYLDLDENNVLDGGEASTVSDADGHYTLAVPADGIYLVRQEAAFGWRGLVHAAAERRERTEAGPAHIIGGGIAGATDYPFMVAVGELSGGNVYQFCGGVLISDRHVVTAAHCTEGVPPGSAGVLVGTTDLEAGGEALAVARVAPHPDYVDPSEGYDIGVWTLVERIDLAGSGLYTVEMLSPEAADIAAPDTLASTLGWGASDIFTSQLQHVHLPIVGEADCAAVYPEASNFETQICAGAPEGGVDSCQGDSGGPLLVRDDEREVWLHAGITSWGDGCALPDTPGIYARISALSDWAKSVAREDGGSIRVSVDGAATADFPTRATTRALTGAIAARWQLTTLAIPEQVEVGAPIDARWGIIGDAGADAELACHLDPDGPGPVPAQAAPCALGENQLELAGFATGLYQVELAVTRADERLARQVIVFAGDPPAVDLQGQLTASDPLDPDYPDPYYVDYFDITGTDGAHAVAIELSSTAFDPFLTLYDADQRDPVLGGGIIGIGNPTADGRLRVVLVPQPGRRYSIGVSTYGPQDVGAYDVSIINDGVLTPQ